MTSLKEIVLDGNVSYISRTRLRAPKTFTLASKLDILLRQKIASPFSLNLILIFAASVCPLFCKSHFTPLKEMPMLKYVTFVVLSILFCIAGTNAQDQSLNIERPSPSSVAKVAGKHDHKVTAELERQQKVLQDISARYEEVSTYDLTPLLKYPYVWSALRENRSRVMQPSEKLTPAQSRLFIKAYDLLEEETLLSFLDHQISLLTDSLDLDENQQQDIQKILTMDLSNKRLLLSTSIASQDFQRRLDKVSDGTEKRILAILYPEQRRVFDRQQMFNRNRLVG